MATQKHLTLSQRIEIEAGIHQGKNKASIARALSKDPSTIAKEIRQHRRQVYPCKMPLECASYRRCVHGRACHQACPDYHAFHCKRRDVSPGACNGCERFKRCRFSKYKYLAGQAEARYRQRLRDSRCGLDLLPADVDRLADVIVPAIQKGQSPYAIVTNHPELGISIKTLYNYIEGAVFRRYGLLDIDLRFKVSRRLRHQANKAVKLKKRQANRYLTGRTYSDYLTVIEHAPALTRVQMDTVYNKVEGPYLQTFKFLAADFLFALYHVEKTAASMAAGLDRLEAILGPALFRSTVELLLTDRGSEFYGAEAMEADGRTRLFYCDPMASGQKGSLEKRHTELRYIVPKKQSFAVLGLTSQDQLNTVLSHLNSYPHLASRGKTPFERLAFFHPEVYHAFLAHGLQVIPKDQVVLKPSLLTVERD